MISWPHISTKMVSPNHKTKFVKSWSGTVLQQWNCKDIERVGWLVYLSAISGFEMWLSDFLFGLWGRDDVCNICVGLLRVQHSSVNMSHRVRSFLLYPGWTDGLVERKRTSSAPINTLHRMLLRTGSMSRKLCHSSYSLSTIVIPTTNKKVSIVMESPYDLGSVDIVHFSVSFTPNRSIILVVSLVA